MPNEVVTLVKNEELYSFINGLLLKAEVDNISADLTARGLCYASLRGVDSHGVRLLPHYMAAIQSGRINKNPKFQFFSTADSTGIFDADHGFGHAAGILAMREAVRMAEVCGTGMVGVKNSSHCGCMAYFGEEAAKKDMIGIALTHATSKVKTPNSTRPFFGTNPICFTAPMADEGPFCYDSAPTPLTSNAVKNIIENDDEIPNGVCADKDGNETVNPDCYEQLLPIGDYKGFGLAMIVDVLCGLLTGMPAGSQISKMYSDNLSNHRYLGQFYIAINIQSFLNLEVFKKKMQALVNTLRIEPKKNPSVDIMAPGDPEKKIKKIREREGIPIDRQTKNKLDKISKEYNHHWVIING